MSSAANDSFPRLLGDIGGTNARFALQFSPGAPLTSARTLSCALYPSLYHAIEQYLRECGPVRPHWAALGVANPVTGDRVSMTNHSWSFSISALKKDLGLARLVVLNDFTALALALPHLPAGDLEQVGGGVAQPGAALGLIGPGTGLGMSGLVPCGHDYTPLRGEGGHVTLAAWDEREAQIIARLRRRYGHVSAERALSGPGLVALYEICAALRGAVPEILSPPEISARALSGACSLCREALDHFCALLGTVAADLALVLGARGGVYLGGGIVPKLGAYFAGSPFRGRFEQKGRFSGYLSRIPTYVIRAPHPGLVGAARALDRAEGSLEEEALATPA
ncbi:MAG: glucokinase [Pseudomonadota bacterium]|jgi:glucokinase